MSPIYFVLAYRDEKDRLVDVARVNGTLKGEALRRVVQSVADQLQKRIEVRKSDTAVPHASAKGHAALKRNPASKRTSKKRRAKKNPARSVESRARSTFKKWHQFDPKGEISVKGSRSIPARLVKLGEIPELVYASDKWGGKKQTYLHKTGRPRPLLCTDPDGKRLFIIGGGVRVTKRGLVG